MKKTLIWTIVGIAVLGLGATAIYASFFPASALSEKEAILEDDPSVDRGSEDRSSISSEQHEMITKSGQQPVAGVLWCRDEFGRLYNIVQTNYVEVAENLKTESKIVSYWFRDDSGRFHREKVEVEINQTTEGGVIWYRDETGRLFKAE